MNFRQSGRTFSMRILVRMAIIVICSTEWNGLFGGQNTFPSSGNAGIGTTSPSTPLEIKSSGAGYYWKIGDGTNYTQYYGGGYNDFNGVGASLRFYSATNDIVFRTGTVDPMVTFKQNGRVGIGTTAPYQKFQVAGGGVFGATTVDPSTFSNGLSVVSAGGTASSLFVWQAGTGAGHIGFRANDSNFYIVNAYSTTLISNSPGIAIDRYGNVGIGTTSPQHPLHVAGIIGAEEVIVSSTGADYVFSPRYRLRPLREVGAYIERHHHLPGIPSAAEVREKGLSVGEMQTKLLAKIEELTLHMIQAEERSERLEEQNRELQKRLAKLEAAGGTAD